MKTKVMTKQCPQCNRKLELNDTNFRRFNGSWRNKCRACQNEHKRKVYHLKKKRKTDLMAAPCDSKSNDFAEKYKQIFALEEKIGILPDCLYLNLVLSRGDKYKAANDILALDKESTYKQKKSERLDALIEQYHQKLKIIKSSGLNVDCLAGKVDSALNQHNQIKLTKTA
jgi:hypothetical protein